ncbi:MAG: DUF4440 domain-containing protein, partial [Gemmatimonadaceae bacterium]
WLVALRDGDVGSIMDLLTDDYTLFAPGVPPQTRAMLAPRMTAALSAYEITPSFECEERIVTEDLVFERGWDVQRVRTRASGDVRVSRQRVFLILQRGSDHRWRFARGMSQPGPEPLETS